MMRSFATTAIVILLAASASEATTIVVDQTGGGDFLTIQEGVDAASFGDTVLVMPGEYREHISMGAPADGVALVGASDPESVVVALPEVYLGQPLLNLEDVSSATLVAGLTFTTDIQRNRPSRLRTAVECHNADALITNNIIRDCDGGSGVQLYAGGLQVYSGAPRIVDNIFLRNQSNDGGAMHVGGGSPLIEGNLFEGNVGWGFGGTNSGGAISIWNGNVTITNNVFRENEASIGGAVFSDGLFVTIQGNLFDGNWAEAAGAAYVDCAEGVLFCDNVLVRNTGYGSGCNVLTVVSTPGDELGIFERNVFHDNHADGDASIVLGGEGSIKPVFSANFFGDDSACLVRAGQCSSPDTVDFVGNWWGSSDQSEIASRVLDGSDETGRCFIRFDPWCDDPSCAGNTTEVPEATHEMSWGRLKSIFR